MHIITILGIVGSVLAGAGFARNRQWVPSLAMAFLLAHIFFNEIFPSVLPEQLVVAFDFIFFALTLVFAWQRFSRKKVI